MKSQFLEMTSPSIFFEVFLFLLLCFWSMFYINIVTVLGVMTIFVIKELTRNLEIGNNPVWILPNIWRLGQVKDIKICTAISNKKLLNTAKQQCYSFYHFWGIKGKPTRRKGKITYPACPPTHSNQG